MNIKIINISLKNAVMPKEFYWNSLKIDRLNEIISNAKPNEPQTFEMLVPSMPLHSSPFNIAFITKNMSDSDTKELSIFKRLSCDCDLKQNRKQKEGGKLKCPHRSIVDLRPAKAQIKPRNLLQLEIIGRYEIVGRHEIEFHIVSSNYVIKLKLIVFISDFNPMSLLLTNKLTPVAIDNLSFTQQVLWFYNPYSSDIQVKLLSHSVYLSFPIENISIKSQHHSSALVNFSPNYIGDYEMKIGIIFNDCESLSKIYAQCTACITNSLYEYAWLKCNSPNNDISSQLNPFVIHGDNLCIVIPQNDISNENLIGLQNSSKHCIKYEWQNFDSLNLSCDIFIEPQIGYLKSGFTKLFHLIVKSSGCAAQMHLIPLKCKIYRYHDEVFREYLLPDGYFEYTDDGYYEKPQNWSPMCFELSHTLYVNINIKVLNENEIFKISNNTIGENVNDSIKFFNYNDYCFEKVTKPHSSTNCMENLTASMTEVNHDENFVMEIIIRSCMERLNSKEKEKEKIENESSFLNSRINFQESKQRNLKILRQMMNYVLFESVSEISKKHRFISSSW